MGKGSKGLKMNIGKTKVMISGRDLHTLQTSGNVLVQYAGEVSQKTQSSVADVRFGFLKSVPISQVD